MLLVRTPVRVSFVGGGSDLAAFYQHEPGAVLSATVDKYIYIGLNPRFDGSVRVSYSRTEEVPSSFDVEHPLVREALALCQITGGIEITSIADIPSKGTGLGSSSAFCVGLLHALRVYAGLPIAKQSLAEDACRIEIDRCLQPIGKQDQFATAFGGINIIRFDPDHSVTVDPVEMPSEVLAQLESHFLVFHTGRDRRAADTLGDQKQRTLVDGSNRSALRTMAGLVPEFAMALKRGQFELLGALLNQNWFLKKTLSPIVSDSHLDDIYQRAMTAGALGGKLLGAGAGGFMLFLAAPDRHDRIKQALSELRSVRFCLESKGSELVYDSTNHGLNSDV